MERGNIQGKGKKKVKTSIYIARFMHQAPLTRMSLKLGRQTAILGDRQTCKHSPGSDPITGTGSASQLVWSPPS